MALTIPNNEYAQYAAKAATSNGVPPEILLGLIQKESNWNPFAINHNKNGTTDYGITQMNDRYYPDVYGMTPYQQIDKSASILAGNYKKTGNWYDAVRQYNGSGSATYGYADDVFRNAAAYGYTTTDTTVAANTGLPLEPSTGGFNPGTGQGTVTTDINGAQTVLENAGQQVEANNPNPGSGAPPAPPTIGQSITEGINTAFSNFLNGIRDSLSKVWGNVTAFSQAHFFNWVIIAGAAVFLMFTASSMVQSVPQVVAAKAK